MPELTNEEREARTAEAIKKVEAAARKLKDVWDDSRSVDVSALSTIQTNSERISHWLFLQRR